MMPITDEQAHAAVGWCRAVGRGENPLEFPNSEDLGINAFHETWMELVHDQNERLAWNWDDELREFCVDTRHANNWYNFLYCLCEALQAATGDPPADAVGVDGEIAKQAYRRLEHEIRSLCQQLADAWDGNPATFGIVMEIAASAFGVHAMDDTRRRMIHARPFTSGVKYVKASQRAASEAWVRERVSSRAFTQPAG